MLDKIFKSSRSTTIPPTDAFFNTTLGTDDIQLSATAAEKMSELMQAADSDMSAIRLFVMGGGCGGMNYSMTYTESQTPFDTILEGDGYKIAVDAVALNYLRGCTIDYVKQGLNESFVFKDVFQSIGGSGGCAGCGASGQGDY